MDDVVEERDAINLGMRGRLVYRLSVIVTGGNAKGGAHLAPTGAAATTTTTQPWSTPRRSKRTTANTAKKTTSDRRIAEGCPFYCMTGHLLARLE